MKSAFTCHGGNQLVHTPSCGDAYKLASDTKQLSWLVHLENTKELFWKIVYGYICERRIWELMETEILMVITRVCIRLLGAIHYPRSDRANCALDNGIMSAWTQLKIHEPAHSLTSSASAMELRSVCMIGNASISDSDNDSCCCCCCWSSPAPAVSSTIFAAITTWIALSDSDSADATSGRTASATQY